MDVTPPVDVNSLIGNALAAHSELADVYDAILAYGRTFRVPRVMCDISLNRGPMEFADVMQTIWPFDIFEVQFTDPIWEPFVGTDSANSYRVRRLLFTRVAFDPPLFSLGDRHVVEQVFIMDRYDVNSHPVEVCGATVCFIGRMSDDNDTEITYSGNADLLPPFGQRHPAFKASQQMFAARSHRQAEADNASFYSQLAAFVSFAKLLSHRGVASRSIVDPERPAIRQQRRASGYVERPFGEIVLRPGLSIARAHKDVEEGKSLRFTPKRRHPVEEHARHYKSGLVVTVAEHLRGGKLGPGRGYDVSKMFPNLESMMKRETRSAV